MAPKTDIFTHGYGAVMRAAAAFKYRMIVVGMCVVLCCVLLAGLSLKTMAPTQQRYVGWMAKAWVFNLAPMFFGRTMQVESNGQHYVVSVDSVLTQAPVVEAWQGAKARVFVGVLGGVVAGAFLAVFVMRRISKKGAAMTGDKHLRGDVVLSEKELTAKAAAIVAANHDAEPVLRLGGVPIARELEQLHILIAGAQRSGKTTAIRQALDVAEKRGEGAVVYDPSGDLAGTYYQPDRGDVILNSYDDRAAVWSLFEEVQQYPDAQLIGKSIVQASPGETDLTWVEKTGSYIGDAIWALKTSGRGTTEELIRHLAHDDTAARAKLVEGLPAYKQFAKGADRATGSVEFGLDNPLRILESMRRRPGTGGEFSWLRWSKGIDGRAGRQPWIFMGCPERYFDVMRGSFVAWINLAAAMVLSLDPDPRRRIWFALDEFAALPPMEVVPKLAAFGPKYGAAIMYALQTPQQLDATWGRDRAGVIVGTAGIHLALRLQGREAMQWAEENFGEEEIERHQESDHLDTEDAHGRSNINVTRERPPLIMGSEFRTLPKLEGFLFVAGVGTGRVKIPTKHLDRPKVKAVPVDPAELWISNLPKPAAASEPQAPQESSPASTTDADEELHM